MKTRLAAVFFLAAERGATAMVSLDELPGNTPAEKMESFGRLVEDRQHEYLSGHSGASQEQVEAARRAVEERERAVAASGDRQPKPSKFLTGGNRRVDDWRAAHHLFERAWAEPLSEAAFKRSTALSTTPMTVCWALRQHWGDAAFANRTEPVVVHLVG
jgi:hypothetical protein